MKRPVWRTMGLLDLSPRARLGWTRARLTVRATADEGDGRASTDPCTTTITNVAEDAWIDTRTRLYWRTPSQEINHLRHCKLADDQLVASMRRTGFYRAHTGHVYRLALLQ
jgi:hypothetical protein